MPPQSRENGGPQQVISLDMAGEEIPVDQLASTHDLIAASRLLTTMLEGLFMVQTEGEAQTDMEDPTKLEGMLQDRLMRHHKEQPEDDNSKYVSSIALQIFPCWVSGLHVAKAWTEQATIPSKGRKIAGVHPCREYPLPWRPF